MIYLIVLIPPFIWGLSPLAIRWTHLVYDPYWAYALRACIAALVAFPVLYWNRRSFYSRQSAYQAAQTGVLVFGAMFLSNLSLKYTTVGKSVFYASSYFIWVPLWKYFIRKDPLNWIAKLSLAVALLGLCSMSEFDFQVVNRGDMLGMCSALFFAAYMLTLEAKPFLTTRPFLLNAIQCLVIAPLALVMAYGVEGPKQVIFEIFNAFYWLDLPLPLLGLLLSGLCVSWMSYTAQSFAQSMLPAHVVGVILLLDSPLACLCGYLFLGEYPSHWTIAGGSLIILAAVLMVGSTAKPASSSAHSSIAKRHALEKCQDAQSG